ncbi:Biphenyl dioxygenase subunit alpha [Planctomycetes bacterium Poly30]|uniref:Biphenyl dioxygenase subunit alpha n=1 Tax=Saltatorellus ferox TaxID=2528018 RepID=A0A518EZB0_9BACT|nr:Biphenyl dioxygenase subunit alpha [Planctomycetes bacterium Poly30]
MTRPRPSGSDATNGPTWHSEPDVRRASTLDERLHHDRAAHELAIERVFVRSWQLLPLSDPIQRVEPLTLLEGGLDEPLVLTLSDDGEQLLSNVCTHRGALLAEAPGDARALRCRYHGRRFDLGGTMTSCPGFEGAECFPRASENLARLPLEQVGPLRFTSIDPRIPFDEWAAPLRRTLAEYDGEIFTFEPSASRDFEIDASWALYCENYLEGFHIPFVHPGLNQGLDFSRYTTELEPYAVRQLGVASRDDDARLVSRAADDVVADYLWLYPNLMVNAYAWGISVNLIEPIGPGRCRVRYLRWVARPDLVGTGVGGALDEVEMEDQGIVLSVQKGVRSRLYPGGRFAPKLETGPHHFQRLMSADLK